MNSKHNKTQSAAIEVALEKFGELIRSAHSGRPIEIDGIRYVPEIHKSINQFPNLDEVVRLAKLAFPGDPVVNKAFAELRALEVQKNTQHD